MSFTYEYPRPAVTTDVLLVTRNNPQKILLIERGNNPFKGKWALPGGFVDMDEDLKDAALRELEEETGISGVKVKQFRTYGGVNRDPRHRTISVVYNGFVSGELECAGQDDAADARWFDLNDLPDLAFDHSLIIKEAIENLNL
ncbi:NUDIX domain-containing protein [Carboxylicivirga linearis]|uniref:NUDIX hydrolase n=1 Tax=Carboxylicivirga linearis TaxID=1628157 RepID=A0ABS5JVV7_9BACT|nr:NUDIX hydrolase [Carboxylicivirga linearis]MBS2099040.1 NUDIX hydrolase [Carboxylicivirga linearis]